MKSIKYTLLFIGILGVVASMYNAITDLDFLMNMSSFVASISLIYLVRNNVVPISKESSKSNN